MQVLHDSCNTCVNVILHAEQMKPEYLILMADIVDSRDLDQADTMEVFSEVVHRVNKGWKDYLLSPLTITLGDEFQGIINKQNNVSDIVFDLEEQLIRQGVEFKLRYVLWQGKIDTPINRHIAYGMMGEGLTQARERLALMKRTSNRFYFYLEDKEKSNIINDAFIVFQSIIDNWNSAKDYNLIPTFLDTQDYKEAALELNKDRSLMWRRMKSLKMDDYFAMKKVIAYLLAKNHIA